jgi:hypothetical protein
MRIVAQELLGVKCKIGLRSQGLFLFDRLGLGRETYHR